ncbi:MAG: hypothetical protein M3Y41_21185 [Pseudomonadota bacterium]|nr:hypothetical protein [Pseudomonadota bacterium]
MRFAPERVAVEFDYGHDGGRRTVAVNAEGLVALLIAHCNRLRLPLPRHAAKRLIVEAEGVALQLDMRIRDAVGEPTARAETNLWAMVWSSSEPGR